jgi:hypothetical protein
MRNWILTCLVLVVFLVGICAAAFAKESMHTGRVMMVVENNLSVMDTATKKVRHFDVGAAMVLRNGLPVSPTALAGGDWVTITAEEQDGRLAATLVEAASDHHAADWSIKVASTLDGPACGR